MVPGIIGNIQAVEVVKMVLGVDPTLILNQRMVFFDAMSMKFRNVKIRGRNVACIACGDEPKLGEIANINYQDFCKTNCNLQSDIVLPSENTMPVVQFADHLAKHGEKCAIIDVRPPVHFGIVSLPGSVNIPFREIEREEVSRNKIVDLCSQKETVFILCRRGNDSREATRLLLDKCNLKNVVNVESGINGYSAQVDSKVPLY